MKASTRIMVRKHGWRLDRFVHNYLYFRFYYPYVRTIHRLLPALKYARGVKLMVPLGRATFDRYHSKVLSRSDTRKIFSINRDISITAKENKRIIPYKFATKIIFHEPEHIAVMDCPCKKSSQSPAEDINSCIAVGKGLAAFWLDHCKKYNARKITQAQALDIIDRLRAKNHITQAFFKVATGGSTGVICNCHPETCVSLQATFAARRIDPSLSMTAASGYSVVHDPARCSDCGLCMGTCNFGAVDSNNSNRRSYRQHLCVGCGLCVEKCPQEALSLIIDPDKPLPLDLDCVEEWHRRGGPTAAQDTAP